MKKIKKSGKSIEKKIKKKEMSIVNDIGITLLNHLKKWHRKFPKRKISVMITEEIKK
jgi:hypothetical protein